MFAHSRNDSARLHLPQPCFVEKNADPIANVAPFGGDVNSRSIDKETVAEPLGPSLYAEGDVDCLVGGTWTPKKEKILVSSFDYIESNPGKEFRTLLLSAFNTLLEVPHESLAIITEVVRILHTASLLIDDIEDNSDQRRGKPTAHRVFGLAQTINTANYKYFVALKELAKLRNPAAAIDIFTVEMLQLHRGQGMELFWRDTLTCPTEEDYLEMASNKTGGLFRLAIKLMQSESFTTIDCMPLVQLLGLIFQIVDDHKNLANADYAQEKGLCDDLTEGKFSFPVIHSIRSNPTNLQLLHILQQKPTDVEMKRCAVAYIASTHSLDYTKSVVEALIDRARKRVDELYPLGKKSWEIHMLLDKLALN